MAKIYVRYIPINLGRRWVYTISEQIKIPALNAGGVVIKDEPILGIQTNKSIYDFGLIECPDALKTTVEWLVDEIWVAVWMKRITTEEARALLRENDYVDTTPGEFLIHEERQDDIEWTIPAKYLIVD